MSYFRNPVRKDCFAKGGRVRMIDKKEPVISILGDSLSTYEGFSPSRGVFFDRYNRAETGILTVEDTWWMKVIRHFSGRLGYNHSMSGSCVTGGGSQAGTARERIEALGINGKPDMILVFMGCNDWAYGVDPREFTRDYRTMIRTVKEMYPEAEIWCGTLPLAQSVSPAERFFFNVDGLISKRLYSEVIIRVAGEEKVHAAEIGADIEYETIDGVHPDCKGMDTLGRLWIRALTQ